MVARVASLLASVGLSVLAARADSPAPASPIEYADAVHLSDLDCRAIHESSGLAISRRDANLLWTHNDSGNSPILYAIDLQGRLISQCAVKNVQLRDWEDMASFVRNQKPYLLVGDVGDNQRRRQEYALHLIPEPSPGETETVVEKSIRFKFAGGPQDCESVGFDAVSNTILLASKTWTPSCTIFALPWPTEDDDAVLTAQPIATLTPGGICGMDVSADGHRAILISYTDAYEVTRNEGQTWAQAFQTKPRQVKMPVRKQGESICYGQDNMTLFLTSEKLPAPLFRVSPAMGLTTKTNREQP